MAIRTDSVGVERGGFGGGKLEYSGRSDDEILLMKYRGKARETINWYNYVFLLIHKKTNWICVYEVY